MGNLLIAGPEGAELNGPVAKCEIRSAPRLKYNLAMLTVIILLILF